MIFMNDERGRSNGLFTMRKGAPCGIVIFFVAAFGRIE